MGPGGERGGIRAAGLRRAKRPARVSRSAGAHRHPARGMLRLIVRAKEVAAGDVEVGAIDESAVLDDQSRALGAVVAGQPIPGDRRRLVVQSMEIVEEIE